MEKKKTFGIVSNIALRNFSQFEPEMQSRNEYLISLSL